jgi:hypothetical protein
MINFKFVGYICFPLNLSVSETRLRIVNSGMLICLYKFHIIKPKFLFTGIINPEFNIFNL